MIRKLMWVVFATLLLIASAAKANTYTAASCNTSDVQTAINSAAEGDTVLIPAGTCTWTSGVNVTVGITIQGAGSGRIVAITTNPNSTLTLTTGSQSLAVSGTQVVCSPAMGNNTCSLAAAPLTVGETLNVYEKGTTSNTLTGTVTSFNSSTGALVMNFTSASGNCTPSSGSYVNCMRWMLATAPSTIIINNNSTTTSLFNLTQDTNNYINVSGIKIQPGTGSAGDFYLNYTSGGKDILLHDMWLENNASTAYPLIDSDTNQIVIWHISADASPFSTAAQFFRIKGAPLSNGWNAASTMGTADTTGLNNAYVEDSDVHTFLNSTDFDDDTRAVWRYILEDDASMTTHGSDSSTLGNRHFEVYNDVGIQEGYNSAPYYYTFDLSNGWIYVRGGTFVWYNNNFPLLNSADYPKNDISLTIQTLRRSTSNEFTCWGAGASTGGQYYHAPRQIGYGYVTGTGTATYPTDGYNSTSYDDYGYIGDSEPIYIWNNFSSPESVSLEDYSPNQCTNPDTVTNYAVLNRDYYDGSTAKPGWSPYTYPHPLTQGSGTSGSVAPPTGLAATVAVQ